MICNYATNLFELHGLPMLVLRQSFTALMMKNCIYWLILWKILPIYPAHVSKTRTFQGDCQMRQNWDVCENTFLKLIIP
jgi:hypothetical protein